MQHRLASGQVIHLKQQIELDLNYLGKLVFQKLLLNLWQKLLQKTTVQKVIIYIMRNEQASRQLANVSIQEA